MPVAAQNPAPYYADWRDRYQLVGKIGAGAFANCTALTSLSIPDSVIAIGNSAFTGCTGLTSLTLPGSVAAIGDSAFANCTQLEAVYALGSATLGLAIAGPLHRMQDAERRHAQRLLATVRALEKKHVL